MKINISRIRDVKGGTLEVEFHERVHGPVTGAGEAKLLEPADVKARVTNTGECMLVNGRAVAKVSLVCDRCLEPFEFTIDTEFDRDYHKGPEEGAARAEEDQGLEFYHGDVVDITQAVEESLAFALPIRVLCDQACKGLCPKCGRNLNKGTCECTEDPDPRLAALGELLKGRNDR